MDVYGYWVWLLLVALKRYWLFTLSACAGEPADHVMDESMLLQLMHLWTYEQFVLLHERLKKNILPL